MMMELLAGNILSTRDKTFALESFMKEQPPLGFPISSDHYQISIPLKHRFSYGVYAREITIPAGATLIGEIHKFENLNILSKGKMTVVTDDGTVTVEAPFTIVSPPGTKRAAFAHTECVWTTIHGTFEKDLDIIEKMFIAKSEQEYLDSCGHQLQLNLKVA